MDPYQTAPKVHGVHIVATMFKVVLELFKHMQQTL